MAIAAADLRINTKLLTTTRHPPRFDLDHTFFPSRIVLATLDAQF